MLILSYVLIFLLSIAGAFGLYFLTKKFNTKKELILKIVSITLLLTIFIRYMLGDNAIVETRGLNMYSPFGDDVFRTFMGLLLIWFTFATTLLIGLNSFFKVKTCSNFLKFVGLPNILLNVIFFKTYNIAIIGSSAFDSVSLRLVLVILETVIALSYLGAVFIRKDYFKVTKEEIKNLLLSVGPILFAIMPAYFLQGVVGFNIFEGLEFDSFTPEHRLMLYASIIIPVLICLALRNKSEEIRRFSMIYLSLATMWTYLNNYGFESLSDPTSWPLHLCNTAMFIIPLCLIFKMNRLFYFTFFINVMGAFIAMAMPNTSSESNILQTSIISFWVNHFCAFFMPVLLVALKLFERPKLKQWIYSMIAFLVYFVFILIINAWFSNYGDVDFFFLNSDFVVDKLGEWAEKTRDVVTTFNIGDLKFTFYPVYQTLFFIVYAFISLAMWFLYEQLFQMWDLGEDRRAKEKEYKQMRKDLAILLEGRSEEEPMSGNGEPCLELKSFSKKYGTNKHYSVKEASLKVEGGEIFGFLGPNGAGKSTIIKSIVGIQTITSGSIEICGYDVAKQSVQAKKQVGFVPDHYALYENLTGREYINYIADLYEVSKEERDARISKYVTNFNLEGAFDNQMKTYSHGMKQKITIMAALVHNPKVWILDEPLTGLDPTSIYQVKESMKDHAREGNIVFFSSHIIDVVERICDRIAIIKKGTILTDVKVEDLDKKGINLEDFYLETINDDLIKHYENYTPDKEKTNVKQTKKVSTKKTVSKITSTKKSKTEQKVSEGDE